MNFKVGDLVNCFIDGQILYTAEVVDLVVEYDPNDKYNHQRIKVRPIKVFKNEYLDNDPDYLVPIRSVLRKLTKLEQALL